MITPNSTSFFRWYLAVRRDTPARLARVAILGKHTQPTCVFLAYEARVSAVLRTESIQGRNRQQACSWLLCFSVTDRRRLLARLDVDI